MSRQREADEAFLRWDRLVHMTACYRKERFLTLPLNFLGNAKAPARRNMHGSMAPRSSLIFGRHFVGYPAWPAPLARRMQIPPT